MQVADVGAVPAVAEIVSPRDVHAFQEPEAGGDDPSGGVDQADDGVVRVGLLDAPQDGTLVGERA